ncbi:LANO_0H16028g1_1 [Lachancea nothofagi CBS 11611]|uniref:LANO_0H16028g1_1 n=1 Tax=Lachancea nothofagi CBS 11611 TaxID=1266666 RepID=A0A1G4KMV3_9SACH|nr:LANO_0H16028g1_1 [Lachancea nothofagi CBS 11611]
MDFESVVHGLQPLLNNQFASKITEDEGLAKQCALKLSELAINLRAPSNRDILRESGVLKELLNLLLSALKTTIENDFSSINGVAVCSELIRSLANCLADNDENRSLFMSEYFEKGSDLRVQAAQVLEFDGNSGDSTFDLKFKTLALIKNLCLDSESYTRDCSSDLTSSLIKLLERSPSNPQSAEQLDAVTMASDLLSEFTQFSAPAVSAEEFQSLVHRLRRIAPKAGNGATTNTESDEEDPYCELVQLLTETLERVVSTNEHIDFSNQESTHKLQKELAETLATLELKETLENKLIIMRRLVSVMGLISANTSNSNLQDRSMCFEILSQANGGYVAAAALVVLSNSISSREAANDVCRHLKLSSIIQRCRAFQDPVQFQGFLDLMKKLLNLSNIQELEEADLVTLSMELKVCHDQCQYFQNLAPLLDAFLTKLVAVLPGSMLRKLLSNGNFKTMIVERGGIAACLLIDKLAVQHRNVDDEIVVELWTSVFRLQDPSVTQEGLSTPFLFQLMKSLGIYLRNRNKLDPNPVFETHSRQLSSLFEIIEPLSANTDSASQSILNNARFVAGMVVELLKDQALTSQESQLFNTATKLLLSNEPLTMSS